MAISFRSVEEYLTFHDPMQGGKLTDRKTEIRFDPLTGETSRILHDPGAPFVPKDYTELAEATGGAKCPFCPDNVFSSTPSFPEKQMKAGRISRGEAVLFPNLFPYGKHNAVVRMTDQHYVRLEQFTVPALVDAFMTAHSYLDKVLAEDARITHVSINWNYLPPSGGSILHPHIQVLASEQPTHYQQTASNCGKQFYEQNGLHYYPALLAEERRLQERWIGQRGMIGWAHAFAPKSHCDSIGVFEDIPSFAELHAQCWNDLAESLVCFFRYFNEIGLASFNLALMIPVRPSPDQWTHVRLVPRITIGALGTSDISVFNFLHGESLSLKVPEQMARDAAAFF